jgi:uncharacterized membrane protein
MHVMRLITGTTALASVLTGGALFAFSSFVMPSFDRLAPGDAIRAMQAINEKAPNSLLLLPLVGSAIGGVVVGIDAVRSDGPGRVWLIIGAVLGIGALAITAAYHQPHNDALARIDSHVADAAARWHDYAMGWTAWNHVRVVTALASGVCLAVGMSKR